MIGYIAYELGYSLLGLAGPDLPFSSLSVAAIQFLVFDNLSFDRVNPLPQMGQQRQPKHYTSADLRHLLERPAVQQQLNPDSYRAAVAQIKAHIGDGDIYQANLTQAFDIQTERSGVEIHRELKRINPAPFSAYLRFDEVRIPGSDGGSSTEYPELEIVSCSPERFWRKTGTSVETRPIKGTIGRAGSASDDKGRIRALLTSPKDRAELLMITDLVRNDLGRCAEIGSVQTSSLRRIRACASVWHLESTVTGEVGPQIRWHDVMRSFFPAGSITGAPKRRAVEVLRDLETVPRGVYCGAIGWVSADGDADFAVAIRTLVKNGKVARVFGGGGIVADSDPEGEYEESVLKIAPMLECLSGDDTTAREGSLEYAQSAPLGK
jgi:para-aminobenzoate synthetase component 1